MRPHSVIFTRTRYRKNSARVTKNAQQAHYHLIISQRTMFYNTFIYANLRGRRTENTGVENHAVICYNCKN